MGRKAEGDSLQRKIYADVMRIRARRLRKNG